MAIYLNGTLIAQTNKVFFNGTQLSSTGKVYGNGTQVWTGGTLTLIEQVFNASGTFIVPSNAINNEFYIGCTGGGGGGGFVGTYYGWNGGGGGGSGRVNAALTLTPGSSIPVTVGAGAGYNGNNAGGTGGASSFGALVSCGGGVGGSSGSGGGGSSGGGVGGKGGYIGGPSGGNGGASNCPAMFTLDPTAIDNTNKFYTAKSYAGGVGLGGSNGWSAGGGAGCYGHGENGQWAQPAVTPNSGSGATGYPGSGQSGKVVIYYYAYL